MDRGKLTGVCALKHYPEPNTGWMNEDGVRIDMQHRLIPKLPLRSALKRPKLLNA